LFASSAVYAKRSASLWGDSGVKGWLLQCCTELTRAMSREGPASAEATLAAQAALYADLQAVTDANRCLAHYSHIKPEDLSGEFVSFPGNNSPLDPTLDDPQYVLSGAVRFQDFMNDEGEFMFAVPAPFVSTLHARRRRRTAGRGRGVRGEGRGVRARGGEGSGSDDSSSEVPTSSDDDNGGERGRGLEVAGPRNNDGSGGAEAAVRRIYGRLLRVGGPEQWGAQGSAAGAQGRQQQAPPTRPNIDLGLPLVQLFLATLFPWVVVPPLPHR
jgi:hypothetical protein